ncbi:MAG: asparagine synthase (glutamine-hydrolyzing) [Planctomycetes bacterium]|nr:asparagine synthase (glutamine-hydrolyzing) [Planctomycetota bacterium]
MCGIAGMFDLRDRRLADRATLQAMTEAIRHRGPDDSGFHVEPGIGLGSRRLSIIDLIGGRQPISNEDGSVWVAFNGELFDYPEIRRRLLARGHRLKTRCDTESIVHLWEDHGEQMFQYLRGQFAFALWDARKRCLILARDRVGICPLYWSQQGDWLLFGSEVKALLASGRVAPKVDVHGIDHLFTFFCQPAARTCFAGVSALLPGQYLKIRQGKVETLQYWDLEFPDQGDERVSSHRGELVDELDHVLTRAVERRLRSDVPVVSYLSGGVDSAVIAALIRRLRGEAAPSFTVRVGHERYDETGEAREAATFLGTRPVVISGELGQLARTYPSLILAAEAPVMDTTCAAMLLQARGVHEHGYKVALTGEGADEALAGYVWFKTDRLRRAFESVTGLWPEVLNWSLRPVMPWLPTLAQVDRVRRTFGCMPAQMDVHNVMAAARTMFYSRDMWQELNGHTPLDDLQFDTARIRRWHPLNRSLYYNYKFMLAGMLLNHKGDRPAMHNSVETRPPFLDEDVIAFCAGIHPKYKLSRTTDKLLLRLLARRLLPAAVAMRPKKMFRAPMWGSFVDGHAPGFAMDLLSPQALAASGYFDSEAIQAALAQYPRLSQFSLRKLAVEMGLINVIATQIWHHTFIDGSLVELPHWRPAWPAAGRALATPAVVSAPHPTISLPSRSGRPAAL